MTATERDDRGREQSVPGTPEDVCTDCNGSGMDVTWHEGATAGESHACGYCQGGTYSGVPAPARDEQ